MGAAVIPIAIGAASSMAAAKMQGAEGRDILKAGLVGGALGGAGSWAGGLMGAAGGTKAALSGAGSLGSSLMSGGGATPNAFGVYGATGGSAAAPSWNAAAAPALQAPAFNPIGQMNQAAPVGFAHQTPGASSGGFGDWLGSLKPADFEKAINTLGPVAMYAQKRKDDAEALELERLVAMSQMQKNAYRPPPSPQLVGASPGQFGGGGNAGFKYGR